MNKTSQDKMQDMANNVMVVKAFQDDGCICDPLGKEYDEQATYEGGLGSRRSFTALNRRITTYHTVLATLTGERRANLSETIPVIDFSHPENTGIMAKYLKRTDNPQLIDPSKIAYIPTTESANKPDSIEYILDEDESIINRAIAGYPIKAHFYNTLERIPSEMNLQVAPSTGQFDYRHLGIKLSTDIVKNEIRTSKQYTSILSLWVSSSLWVYFNPDIAYKEDEGTDDYGVDLADETTECEEKHFIIKENDKKGRGTHKLILSQNDICVIFPSSTYAHNPVKILIFKYLAKEKSSIPQYHPYVVYALKASPSDTFLTIPIGGALPSYLLQDSILTTLSKYDDIKKNYYGKASGLLAGYFSHPELKVDQNGNPSMEISQWIFENDTDRASQRGVSIDIGSKYFEGHILNRGSMLNEPLKLTAHDKIFGYSPYKGKATLAYDRIHNTIGSLFDPVLVDRDIWGKFENYNLDYIFTSMDYSRQSWLQNSDIAQNNEYKKIVNPKGLSLRYPDIFKKPDGESLTEEDIHTLINEYVNCFEGDTLVLDSTNSKNVSYKYEIVRNTGWFDWGWVKSSSTVDHGNKMSNDFYQFAYEEHVVRLRKNGSSIDSTLNYRCSVRSIFDTFARAIKKTDSNGIEYSAVDGNTILIYPQSPRILPRTMYLISRVDLGLEEYVNPMQGSTASSRSMCSFYNIKEGKIISFKVAEVRKALLSKIKKVRVTEPETGEVKTLDIGSIVASHYLNIMVTHCFDKSSVYNQLTADFSSEITLDNLGNMLGTDSYIYVLEPMTVSLAGLTLYDAEDNPIDFQKSLGDVDMMPMAHPSDYFSVTGETYEDGTPYYRRDEATQIIDFGYLMNSWIVPGLPKFNDPSELENYDHKGNKLTAFSSLMGKDMEGIKSMAIKKSMELALYDWKLSDSDINPIRLRAFPSVLKGLLESKDCLQHMTSQRVDLPLNDEQTEYLTLTEKSFQNLYEMIDNGRETSIYNTHIKSPLFVIADSSKSFESNMERILGKVDVSTSYKDSVMRTSIKTLYSCLENMFSGDGTLSREDCIALDKCLGNGTKAFLSIGTSADLEDTPQSIVSGAERLGKKIEDCLIKMDISYKSATLIPRAIEVLNDYYTQESSEAYARVYYQMGNDKSDMLKVDYRNIPSGLGAILDGLIDNSLTVPKPSLTNRASYNFYERANAIFRYQNYTISIAPKIKNLTREELVEKYKLYMTRDELCQYNRDLWLKASSDEYGNKPNLTELENYVNESYWETLKDIIEDFALIEATERLDREKQNSNALDRSVILAYMEDNLKATVNDSGELDKSLMNISFAIPKYVDETMSSLAPTSRFWSDTLGPFAKEQFDTSIDLLSNLAKFIKISLQGSNGTAISYVEGDNLPEGNENSLYYQRYCMLNNRMNTSDGPLYKASLFLQMPELNRRMAVSRKIRNKSYYRYMVTQPLVGMEPIMYLPPRDKTQTTSFLPSKFCYEKELEVLREIINSKCVLTCHICKVRHSCPFYDEEEVTRTTASDVKTIDLWVKDNELDLLVYDEDSPEWPRLIDEDGSIIEAELLDSKQLKDAHKPYSDVTHVYSSEASLMETYDSNNLEFLREQIRHKYPDFDADTKGGIGWLLGARYGTINNFHCLKSLADQFPNEKMPNRTYMHNALFISDTESDVVYAPSANKYPVKVTLGAKDRRQTYAGKVRIKMPVALKMFNELNVQDDIYLVSDDKTDSEGNKITAVIYINTLGNLRYLFDLRDQNPEAECLDSMDTTIYPRDVAQWCVNYAKGICLDNPLEATSTDLDQYWMETIHKKNGKNNMIEVEGRPRYNAGYVESIVGADTLDPIHIAIQKPISANYINFKRKFMISMDCVRWVKDGSSLIELSGSLNPDEAKAKAIEKQKAVLPLMKTNLRLVAIRQPATNSKEEES